MKKLICVLTAGCIFFAGCAGREANLIQIHQFGDGQKTCDALRTELYFIENEISRLLPKADKTGKNIALAATGIIFIIPLFFMDLKQGEKKEIEAYRQRYNHLLMITQQRDCKLPLPVTKEIAERIPSAEEQKEIYVTKVISEPPGARIELDNDYIGDAPLEIRWQGFPKYNTFARNHELRALPLYVGQFVQTKFFYGRLSRRDKIPKTIFFDMKLRPIPKRYEIDIE